MQIVEANNSSKQNKFLKFRRQLYKNSPLVDNNYYLLKQIFAGKMKFMKKMKIWPVMIESDEGSVIAEGIVAYSQELSEYIQLCFFEWLQEKNEEDEDKKAAEELISYACKKGREENATKLVVGLYGHVNYGLGMLHSHYDCTNSFSSPYNPKYYCDYFEVEGYEKILLNSYEIKSFDNRLDRYRALLDKINRNYEFKFFDKRNFDYWSKIYTDLNNECFVNHRYYYKREYEEDKEMLKELFMFIKEDSLIFAFRNGEPAGFIMWYPDFNELAAKGEVFGAKHYIKNIFLNKKIRTAKIMEFGVKEEYRKSGLALGLVEQVLKAIKNYGCSCAESSWILAENLDSNSVCSAVCDSLYKEYVVYEKDIT